MTADEDAAVGSEASGATVVGPVAGSVVVVAAAILVLADERVKDVEDSRRVVVVGSVVVTEVEVLDKCMAGPSVGRLASLDVDQAHRLHWYADGGNPGSVRFGKLKLHRYVSIGDEQRRVREMGKGAQELLTDLLQVLIILSTLAATQSTIITHERYPKGHRESHSRSCP